MSVRRFAISSAWSAPSTAPIVLTGGITDNMIRAAMMGYQGLEIHMRETTVLDYEKIAQVSQEYNIGVSAVVTGRLNTEGKVSLIDDRPYVSEAAIEGLRAYTLMASKLKTDLIIGWVKGNIPPAGDREFYMERLAHNLRIVCQEAKERGVRILIEVINRYEVNIFNTTEELLAFLSMWEIPNAYVHLDTFHMNIEESNPYEAIRACGNQLGYFHVADNTRCYPGSGTLDFGAYLEVLDEVGYTGYISVECFPKPSGEEAAKRGIAHLTNL